MRILFLGPNQLHRYNSGHQRFRNEIAESNEVTFVGPGWGDWPLTERRAVDVPEMVKLAKPEIIMTYSLKYTTPIVRRLAEVKIPKVHFLDDFVPHIGRYPGYEIHYTKWLTSVPQDIVFCRTMRAKKIIDRRKLARKSFLLPFSFDPARFRPASFPFEQRSNDVFAGMSLVEHVYPNRPNVLKAVRKHFKKSVVNRLFDEKYVEALQNSKITINSMNVWRSFNFKMLEGPACGSLLMTDDPEDKNGMKPNVHYIQYSNVDNMVSKIKYLLANPAKLQDIAFRGMLFVHERHSNSARVKKMNMILEREL